MDDELFYKLDRKRMGTAIIVNNLNKEQTPTRNDVERMSNVLKVIGFDVEIYTDMTGKQMNDLKHQFTEETRHRDANCFLILIISHGTADNFIQCTEGSKTWNIECLVTEVSDIKTLEGRPKLFFIEACRGQESNLTNVMMTKSGPLPQQMGISLPSKQDVFVGFATVPGFASFTSLAGSPYLQSLSSKLEEKHSSMDLSDIHLLVKRQLATTKLAGGNRQGAEERSSLLFKLMFSKYQGNHRGCIKYITDGGPKKKFLLDKEPTVQQTMPPPKPSRLSLSSSLALNSPSPTKEIKQIPIVIENTNNLSRNQRARSDFFSSLAISTPSTATISASSSSLASWLSSRESKPQAVDTSPAVPITPIVKPPRSAMYNFSRNHSSLSSIIPSTSVSSNIELGPIKQTQLQTQSSTFEKVIEISSGDIEKGLKDLLENVKEVYGGDGKVKIKKKFGKSKEPPQYALKYVGPENAAKLLDKALNNIKELQSKGTLWKFTQKIEVSIN